MLHFLRNCSLPNHGEEFKLFICRKAAADITSYFLSCAELMKLHKSSDMSGSPEEAYPRLLIQIVIIKGLMLTPLSPYTTKMGIKTNLIPLI